ncbi:MULTISPECIES: methyltransferase domain-containing protein [unclassified Bradyrhizobium]|uniref:class I SAM-dependent methyltransferase n=1 Tax=unclassified Bradyrhizobium TaxID=2631580 RepID=UPI00339785BE
MPEQRRDVWAGGDAYEPYVARWSRLVAGDFLDWLDVGAGKRWLDVGCGTGALSATILERTNPQAVLGVDPSDGFIAYAQRAITDCRATFRVGDAQQLPVSDATFDVAVAGLVINFVPNMAKAVSETRRALCPGRIAAAYVWDYAGEMQMMRRLWDAAVALNPAALEKDEGRRFPVCSPEPLATLFKQAGLTKIDVQAIDAPTVFRDFDDYWKPFLGGQAPAPGYCMSLSDDRRAALREHIRLALPFQKDGSIHLIARAWAVRGSVAS